MREDSSRPDVVAVADERPRRELRLRVRELLASGGLVALPTETVYGIAARADDEEALERLRALKGRDPDLSFTWAVTRREEVERFEPLTALTRRLAERYWPGPLTLVLRGVPEGLAGVARDGWTGLRLPAHAATRALLEALPFPVVLTSANRSGDAPETEADAVAERFRGADPPLDLVVDGGPSLLREASGVLCVGPGRFELLREGLLPIADLRRTAGLRIAFVCTGNTCRSPMAEGLARDLLARRLGDGGPVDPADFGFEVVSRGVAAGAGSPASRHAVDVLAERGIDLSGHRSHPALPEELRGMDRVYCLTSSHRDALVAALPPGAAKHVSLLDPEGRDVPDPIGGSRSVYEECAAAILRAVEARAEGDWL